MSDQGWHQVKSIVDEALDRAPAARAAFLNQTCGHDVQLRAQVEELLGLQDKADAWFGAATASVAGPAASAAGRRHIGRYEIRGVIAAGGMGTVYEAVQDHPHRLVALKLLHRGAASPQAMKRFRQEAEILGRLRHPHIAHIHDAGTCDEGEGEQPYFVMELVKGEPLIRYADSRKLGTRQRMELFVKICEAVQYAHNQSVIHRDLKPDNILVDDLGEPKILDFGVARVTGADIQLTTFRTDIGQIIGTVPYMSPEQVTGDPALLDTRTDVYSLGVLLYEFVSGRLPHDLSGKTIAEAARVIREDDPTPLSSIDRVFRGDVETIVAKALSKEKDRRYQTAADLASDVRRYLTDEPIVARPASTFYQLSKFARRNKALVGGAAVAVTALLVGTTVATWQTVQATRARREAEHTNSFLFEVLGATDIVEAGHSLSVEDLLDRAVAAIPLTFAGQSQLEATVRHHLGISYASLSEFDKSLAQLRAAQEIRARELGPEHPDTLDSMAVQADVFGRIYRWADSAQLWRQVIAGRQRALGPDDPDTLRAMGKISGPLSRLERFEEAADLADHSARGLLRVLGEEHEDAIYAYLWTWSPLYQLGRYDEIEPILVRAVTMAKRSLAEDNGVRLLATKWLGEWRCRHDAWDEGWPLLQQALVAQQRLYPGDDLRTLQWTSQTGIVMARHGPDPATRQRGLEQVREAVRGIRRVMGDDHIRTAYPLQQLADLERSANNLETAAELLRLCNTIKRANLPADHPHVCYTTSNLGWTLVEMGRVEAGEQLLREAVECYATVLSRLPDSPMTQAHRNAVWAHANLASALERAGRATDSEAQWRAGMAIQERAGDHGWRAQESRLAINLEWQGRVDEAEEHFRRVHKERVDTLGTEHQATTAAQEALASFLERHRDATANDEAEQDPR